LPTVTIGAIGSQKACTVYQQSAGRSALLATPNLIAAASSWRTWLVHDCIDHFATIRTSLEAALAASGKFVVVPRGGRYLITGSISDVSEGGPAPATPAVGSGYAISSSYMFVNMDVKLSEASGRTLYGGLLTKRLETGSNIEVSGFHTTSTRSGQALYTELQHEVALATARLVAFHIVPLSVTASEGRTIQLNYGAPLLALGTIVQVTSPDGGASARYTVTAAGPQGATAQLDGDGSPRITVGSIASVIEPDDLAANGRRLTRVELP
jgi:hypothetical protein